MVRTLPPLETFRFFEAAARHLNFTHAAEEMHVTHGAVSQRIKRLEEHLGTPLFRRSDRGMLLTDEGHRLLERGPKSSAKRLRRVHLKTTFRLEAAADFCDCCFASVERVLVRMNGV